MTTNITIAQSASLYAIALAVNAEKINSVKKDNEHLKALEQRFVIRQFLTSDNIEATEEEVRVQMRKGGGYEKDSGMFSKAIAIGKALKAEGRQFLADDESLTALYEAAKSGKEKAQEVKAANDASAKKREAAKVQVMEAKDMTFKQWNSYSADEQKTMIDGQLIENAKAEKAAKNSDDDVLELTLETVDAWAEQLHTVNPELAFALFAALDKFVPVEAEVSKAA